MPKHKVFKLKTELIMSFDFGMSFIGVAIGEEITKTATPKAVLKANEGKPNWDEVAALINTWNPKMLVVGMPRDPNGELYWLSESAMKFGKRLHGRFGLPVDYADETCTTREAKTFAKQAKKPVERRDAIAAALILEGWFNT